MDCRPLKIHHDYQVHLIPRLSLRKVYIEVTNTCNLGCIMCYRSAWRVQEGFLPLAVYRDLLVQLGAFPLLTQVVFGGIGEPTLHPDLPQMVREAAAQGYLVTVTTNGTKLYGGLARELAAAGLHRLVVSVDSPQADRYQAIRQADLANVLTGLEQLRKFNWGELGSGFAGKKIQLEWEFVAMAANVGDLPYLVDLASTYGVQAIHVSHLMPVTSAAATQVLYTPGARECFRQIGRQAANRALARGITLGLPASELKTERRCRFMEQDAAVVACDGRVVPCYRLLYGYPEYVFGRCKQVQPYHFGNIHQQSLQDIWVSRTYMGFRFQVRENRYPSCPDCDLVDGCDLVTNSEMDCNGNTPSCGDCLWARGLIYCP